MNKVSKTSKVFVAGHRGMVGSAVVRVLKATGYENLILAGRDQVDLTNQSATSAFIRTEKPDVVIIAAAKVGGILANSTQPYPFLYENLMIEANLIHTAHHNGVDNLIFLGSSCIYPKLAEQPLREESLLTGPLEPTNEWYAIAKITGIKLCQALNQQYGRHYISLMPSNLYGPGDNFDLESSHVLPAMIRKFHEAKSVMEDGDSMPVTLWGTGSPRREFLHVDDLAQAVVFAIENRDDIKEDLMNVGVGEDITIRELAELIQKVVGFKGKVQWDLSKPDGTPRKLMETSKMAKYGWKASIPLEEGIQATYEWFLNSEIRI